MPKCPKCARADQVTGGYYWLRDADVYYCHRCYREWEMPTAGLAATARTVGADTESASRAAAEARAAWERVQARAKTLGLPIVSPLTPGTLRGYADGGVIAEPTILTDPRTGRQYGILGEQP